MIAMRKQKRILSIFLVLLTLLSAPLTVVLAEDEEEEEPSFPFDQNASVEEIYEAYADRGWDLDEREADTLTRAYTYSFMAERSLTFDDYFSDRYKDILIAAGEEAYVSNYSQEDYDHAIAMSGGPNTGQFASWQRNVIESFEQEYDRLSKFSLNLYKDMVITTKLYLGLTNSNASGASVDRIVQLALAEADAAEQELASGTVNNRCENNGDNDVTYNTWYYGYEVSGDAFQWCAVFVSWLINQTGMNDGKTFPEQRINNCGTFEDWFIDNGNDVYRTENTVPMGGSDPVKPGDIAIFHSSETYRGHIGLVVEVGDDYITLVEGNSSNKVSKNVYYSSRNGRYDFYNGRIISINYPAAADGPDGIYYYLTNALGFSSAAACGILGNMEQESNFEPDCYGDYGIGTPSGVPSSYGLCQWHLGRWDNLKAFCASKGYDVSSIEGQLNFLLYELQNSYNSSVYQPLLNVPNTKEGAEEAAKVWCLWYEVPANRYSLQYERASMADYYWDMYGPDGNVAIRKTSVRGNGGERIAKIAHEEYLKAANGDTDCYDAYSYCVNKYCRWFESLYPNWPQGGSYDGWCQIFICWCINEAGLMNYAGVDNGKVWNCADYMGIDVYLHVQALKGKYNMYSFPNCYPFGTEYTPKPGDIVIWPYRENVNHIGLIYDVDQDGMTIIEGNNNSTIKESKMDLSTMYYHDYSLQVVPFIISVPWPNVETEEDQDGGYTKAQIEAMWDSVETPSLEELIALAQSKGYSEDDLLVMLGYANGEAGGHNEDGSSDHYGDYLHGCVVMNNVNRCGSGQAWLSEIHSQRWGTAWYYSSDQIYSRAYDSDFWRGRKGLYFALKSLNDTITNAYGNPSNIWPPECEHYDLNEANQYIFFMTADQVSRVNW